MSAPIKSPKENDTVSVVVPVYNSEVTLSPLVARLKKILEHYSAFEIILVNDGSRDNSWDAIKRLASESPSVRGIDLGKNYGQHNALLAGIRAARYLLIVTLDDDLQNPPEEIPKLLGGLRPNVDVVYGARKKEQHGVSRNLASRAVKLSLAYFMGAKTASRSSAFRLFRTGLREGFKDYQCDFISIDVLLSWTTSRFAFVEVRHDERKEGRSNYNPWRLYRHALNMITGYTTLPLQIATGLGLALTLVGVLILLFVLYNFFAVGSRVPGFAFLASMISVFSGATLFSIGIMGEYLARMYSRLLHRPTYTIRGSTENSAPLDEPIRLIS